MKQKKEKREKIIRSFQGVVVSSKMDQTAVVEVERIKMHPLYKKRIKVHKRFHVHNPDNKYKQGDKVEFCECRPLSKTKRWRIIKKYK